MTIHRSRATLLAAFVFFVLVGVGCTADKSQQQTDKELAQKRWAAARSNVMVTLAKDQFAKGQIDKSRQTTDEALRLTPENPQAHLLSARLHIEKGQLEAAQRELEAARQFAPNDGENYYLSGVVMQRWQKQEAAYEMYKTAAEKSPAELAYVLAVAESLVTLERTDEALALLQSRSSYFEHSGTIRDMVGQLQMQKGQFVEAARSFRQASILSEDEPAIKERLAMALVKTGQFRDAHDVLMRVVQIEANAKRGDLFAMLGECQLALGQPREARLSFETATTADPLSASAWRGLGRAALDAGDNRRAELALTKLLKLDPGQPQNHLLFGYLMVQKSELDAALKSFKTASSLDPADTAALCMIGYVYEKQKKPELAGLYYGKALQLRPGDEMARRLMAGLE